MKVMKIKDRTGWLLAGSILSFSLVWLILATQMPALSFESTRSPLRVAIEVMIVAGCFFGGLTFYLFPADKPRARMRWLATGLLTLAAASLLLGILPLLFQSAFDINQTAWTWFAIRILSLVIFALGMLPRSAWDLRGTAFIATSAATLILISLVTLTGTMLPPLLIDQGPNLRALPFTAPLASPLPLHIYLSAAAIALSLVVVVGAVIRSRRTRFDRWLIAAFSLLAASQIWKTTFPGSIVPVVSPAELLSLAFSVSIAVAGVIEMRRVSEERATIVVLDAVTAGKLSVLSREDIQEAIGQPAAAMFTLAAAEDLEKGRHYLKETIALNFPDLPEPGKVIMGAGEAMSNAIKHAGSGTLQVFKKPSRMQIVVSDYGQGIHLSDLPRAVLVAGYSKKRSLGMGFTVMLDVADALLLATGPDGTTIVLEVASGSIG